MKDTTFDDLVDMFNDNAAGFYAVVEWDIESTYINRFWITGPYESKQRAQMDVLFFDSSPNHMIVKRGDVAGGQG